MDKLKTKRSNCKANIFSIVALVEKNPIGSSMCTLTACKSNLNEIVDSFTDFKALNDQMVDVIEATEQVKNEEYVTAVRRKFYATKILLEQYIDELKPQTSRSIPDPNATQTGLSARCDVQLPRMALPTFSGNYTEWMSFSDIFRSAVDANTTLTDAQKLQYLKSALKDEALQLIIHFSVTNDNYSEAWNQLTSRYDKKKKIIQAHIGRFMDQPSVSQKSVSQMRQLTNTSNQVIRALKALNCESRDQWLIYILLGKLDSETITRWSEETVSIDMPTIEKFLEFLESKCYALETVQSSSTSKTQPTKSSTIRTNHLNHQNTVHKSRPFNRSIVPQCTQCKQMHPLYQCSIFKGWLVPSRRDFVKNNNLCFNCLSKTHSVLECSSRRCCGFCSRRHHSLLCLNPSGTSASSCSSPSQQPSSQQSTSSQQTTPSDTTTSNPSSTPSISTLFISPDTIAADDYSIGVLPTAVVHVNDSNGHPQSVRVLFDHGSSACLISEKCVKKLGLPRRAGNLQVKGVAASNGGSTNGVTTLTIMSRLDQTSSLNFKAYILNVLTDVIPSNHFEFKDLGSVRHLHLADPEFNTPNEIDIIIGSNKYLQTLTNELFYNNKGEPIAYNTLFGWVISCELEDDEGDLTVNHIDIDEAFRKFWEIQEIAVTLPFTKDEELCETHFAQTHTRSSDGRYMVRLPFKPQHEPISSSVNIAVQRLQTMERKFTKNSSFQQKYCDFMDEFLMLDHMEKIPPHQIQNNRCFYLPHHAVLKESSTSTKLRVVFDASANSNSGISLNNALLVGPTIQDDLYQIILRFRMHQYVFTADIEKMYRQVLMHKEDIDYQRIVWRRDVNLPIEHFRLKTVAYGTASAPYLATKALQQLGEDNKNEFPNAAEVIKRDFYVDDIMSGSNDLNETIILQQQLISILGSGGFPLKKWASNSPELLSSVPIQDREVDSVDIFKSIKTLGIHWSPLSDIFSFKLNQRHAPSITKRYILSESSRLFDPLGWLSPTVVLAKILLQKLWLTKLSWDEELPIQLSKEWTHFEDNLHHLQSIEISRWLPNYDDIIEFHGFCDASTTAYAAVIYSRSVNKVGNILINLVTGKTKVAPVKLLTVPRLELVSALLLTRLMLKVVAATSHLKVKIYLWSDSTIVLAWLSSHPRRWQTFVANRTTEILESFTSNQWSHVRTEDNPADCASRGISPVDLPTHHLWWSGPDWLHKTPEHWPAQDISIPEVICPEEKKTTHIHTVEVQQSPLMLQKFSDYLKIIRCTAWCRRFINNSRPGAVKSIGCLTTVELNQSLNIYLQWIQRNTFGDEINALKKQENISSKSKLRSLHPFIDQNGLLRVGGRLDNSDLPFSKKHPIILVGNNEFTRLLIRFTHTQYLHAGFTLLSSIISQKYWVIGARDVIRKIVFQCTICFRQKSQMSKQIMGNLPLSRVTPSHAFSNVGVDFAGPITTKSYHGRGSKREKSYIAVFVCFTTKAVHLEAVSSLSSDAFIACFKRFSGRRGHATNIYSDNGTNFVGARRKLSEMQQLFKSQVHRDTLSKFSTAFNTEWHFNPPASPHFGGLWESAVKSVKYHLKRVLFNHILTFEELSTVLTQIEACLNSRPLCQMSTDPQDVNPLTPAHFLVGQPLTTIPEPDRSSLRLNQLDRWELVQKLNCDFWNRWHKEYLSTLQPRKKWQTIKDNLKENDLVVIRDENMPPAQWLMGRIIKVHPGQDGRVRVVTVRHKGGEFQRPVHKLSKVPMQ